MMCWLSFPLSSLFFVVVVFWFWFYFAYRGRRGMKDIHRAVSRARTRVGAGGERERGSALRGIVRRDVGRICHYPIRTSCPMVVTFLSLVFSVFSSPDLFPQSSFLFFNSAYPPISNILLCLFSPALLYNLSLMVRSFGHAFSSSSPLLSAFFYSNFRRLHVMCVNLPSSGLRPTE